MALPRPARTRPTRFAIPNNEQVVLSVAAERFTATLCLLSLTGGTLRPHQRLTAGTFADATIKTISGPVRAVIQLLAARPGTPQPFRFIHIEPAHRPRLEKALKELRSDGLGDDLTAADQVLSFARRLLPRALRS